MSFLDIVEIKNRINWLTMFCKYLENQYTHTFNATTDLIGTVSQTSLKLERVYIIISKSSALYAKIQVLKDEYVLDVSYCTMCFYYLTFKAISHYHFNLFHIVFTFLTLWFYVQVRMKLPANLSQYKRFWTHYT